MLYDGAELGFTLRFGFIPERYWRAVFRVGYLALFQRFGYSFILSEGGEQARRVLSGGALPEGLIFQASISAELASPLLLLPLTIESASFYMVILRVRSCVTRHLCRSTAS